MDNRFPAELRAASADAAAVNLYGVASRCLACENGNAAIVRALLAACADPNAAERGARLYAVNALGWTPVHVAGGVGYTPAVFERFPEAAASHRKLMAEQGLPVPPPLTPRRVSPP